MTTFVITYALKFGFTLLFVENCSPITQPGVH